ncbi:MAG: class I SAM-dependent methyltransferase, partial [Planctomycetota bacterium]
MARTLLGALGIKQETYRNGVRYELVRHAPAGPVFDVIFPSGRVLRIDSGRIPLDDITLSPRAEAAAAAVAVVPPGSRVLDASCGCGGSSMALTQITGRGGAVIGIDSRPEALEYARLRYTAPNLGFERGTLATGATNGELTGGFDACFIDASVILPTDTDREACEADKPEKLLPDDNEPSNDDPCNDDPGSPAIGTPRARGQLAAAEILRTLTRPGQVCVFGPVAGPAAVGLARRIAAALDEAGAAG